MSSLLIIGTNRLETLECSYARTFRKLNWDVHIWDPMRAYHRWIRGGRLGQFIGAFIHIEAGWRSANRDLLRLIEKTAPDLILVIGTTGVRAGTLGQIRACWPKTLIYCIYPDSPHNLDNDRVHCLPFFDRVTTSSPAWVEAFERLGASKVHYLPFAADVELHRPVNDNQIVREYAHDISFIGSWRPEREQFLEKLVDLDLKLWGSNHWKNRTRQGSSLKACWGGSYANGSDFVRVCNHSKIMLNIMDTVTRPGPNMRTFELPACRAFALVERSPAVLDLFCEGVTIECFDTLAEAREKIHYYLDHETARARIAEASYQFVTQKGHTYFDRVQQILNWMSEDRC